MKTINMLQCNIYFQYIIDKQQRSVLILNCALQHNGEYHEPTKF